jgi:transposase
MEERLRFVARLLESERMSEVCRDFGISRKTGYKIFNRYRQEGLVALTDRSRRPVRYANQLPDQIEAMIIALKKDKPHWGKLKIRELLVRKLAGDMRIPSTSTVHAVLDRYGLVAQARRRQRNKAEGTELSQALAPSDLWCVDFNGEFKLGDGRYCYPLTVTGHASRYLLACEAFSSNRASCHRGLSPAVCRARPTKRNPQRQRRAFRQPERSLQSFEAVHLVAEARHRHRTHQAGPSATERPARTHTSDIEEGSHTACGHEHAAAASTIRRFRQRIQYGTTA